MTQDQQVNIDDVGWTAVGVAWGRAQESRRPDRLCSDPLAADFVAAAAELSPESPLPFELEQNQDRLLATLMNSMVDYVAIRTLFFDRYFQQAMNAGVRQVVLFAAGLDARAYRLDWPTGVRLFELDMPGMLRFKDQVIESTGRKPTCDRTAIPIDLREDWPITLRQVGFQPNEPSAWLAEGLLPYLDAAASSRMLRWATELSAPGSWLALEHVPSSMKDLPSFQQAAKEAVSGSFNFEALWQGGLDAEPVAWLADRGWQAMRHSVADLAVEYDRPMLDFDGFDLVQLVSARR